MNRTGVWVRQQSGPGGYSAFIPAPLPPVPSLELRPELNRIYEEAVHAVGQIEGVSRTMDLDRLLSLIFVAERLLSQPLLLLQPVPEGEPRGLLRRPATRPRARRLGGVDAVLSRRRGSRRASGGRHVPGPARTVR